MRRLERTKEVAARGAVTGSKANRMTEPVAEDHAARLASSLTKLAAYFTAAVDRYSGGISAGHIHPR
jgi:hypothetical protein